MWANMLNWSLLRYYKYENIKFIATEMNYDIRCVFSVVIIVHKSSMMPHGASAQKKIWFLVLLLSLVILEKRQIKSVK